MEYPNPIPSREDEWGICCLNKNWLWFLESENIPARPNKKLEGDFEGEEKKLVGADPLPPALGNAKVWLGEEIKHSRWRQLGCLLCLMHTHRNLYST
jgi:hypothetical protein